MDWERHQTLEWTAAHPWEDTLLPEERELFSPVLLGRDPFGVQTIVPPAVRRRREDPNP